MPFEVFPNKTDAPTFVSKEEALQYLISGQEEQNSAIEQAKNYQELIEALKNLAVNVGENGKVEKFILANEARGEESLMSLAYIIRAVTNAANGEGPLPSALLPVGLAGKDRYLQDKFMRY